VEYYRIRGMCDDLPGENPRTRAADHLNVTPFERSGKASVRSEISNTTPCRRRLRE